MRIALLIAELFELLIGFIDQPVEFRAGHAEGFGLTAEHRFSGIGDVFAQLLHCLCGLPLGLQCFLARTVLGLETRVIEILFESPCLGFADGFVEFAGEERLSDLGLLTQGADAIQEFVEFLRLILQGTSQFRPLEFLLECFGGIVEGAVFGGGLIVEGLVNFVLSLREIPGVLPQALRFVGELAGGAFAEILLHGLELTLSAGGGLGGFGQLLLFELLSRIEDLFPRFVELVASLGHLGGVGGFVHFLAEIVEVLEELFLFLLELFELAREFLLFLLALGVAQLVLELLHFLGQRLLASRELFQPGEHLKALLLFRRRLRGGLAFFFVALVVLFELEGGELFLLLLGTSPARWRLVLAGDLVFAALGTLQPFESALLESEGLIQGAPFGFITCLLKGIQRITHALPSLGQCLAQLGILRFFHGFLDHVQGNLLRFGDDSDVIRCILDFFAA